MRSKTDAGVGHKKPINYFGYSAVRGRHFSERKCEVQITKDEVP